MLKFSLSQSVGKGAIGTPAADAEIIQRIFSKMKDSKLKPLYQGRIDGKAGPKTIAAIACYQAARRIKVTGKVEPIGQTISKLKMESIPGLQADLDAAKFTVSKTNVPASQVPKLPSAQKQQATFEIDKFEKSAPVRESEAKILASALRSLMKSGILVVPAFLDANPSGHITVELEALYPKPKNANEQSALATSIKTALQGKVGWTFQAGSKLRAKTVRAYAHLRGAKPASREFLKFLGLSARFDYSLTVLHLGGLERSIDAGESKRELDIQRRVIQRDRLVSGKGLISGGERRLKRELELLISALEGTIIVGTIDAPVRAQYSRQIKRMSDRIFAEASSGKIDWDDAAKQANTIRNRYMDRIRAASTHIGRNMAQGLKPVGIPLSINDITDPKVAEKIKLGAQERAMKNLGIDIRNIDDLSPEERLQVQKEVIRSAGRSGAKVDLAMKGTRLVGRLMIPISVATAAWQIYEAENKILETGRQVSIAGGAAGGAYILGTAGAVFGPVGAIAGIIIGGIVGGIAGEEVFEGLTGYDG